MGRTGQGVQVHISVWSDYQIETDTNGYFDTQTEFPANTTYEVDVLDPSSGLRGRNFVAMFDGVPLGTYTITSSGPLTGGNASGLATISYNAQTVQLVEPTLGNLRFDEDLPSVVQVTPADATLRVPITHDVELLFNEALDSNSLDPSGIFILGTNGIVSSTLTLLPDTNGVMRLVRIQPKAPLQSLQVYEAVVLAGDVPGPNGSVIGSGPRDLVGRPMAAPFESRFATADSTPPQLVSMFPANGEVHLESHRRRGRRGQRSPGLHERAGVGGARSRAGRRDTIGRCAAHAERPGDQPIRGGADKRPAAGRAVHRHGPCHRRGHQPHRSHARVPVQRDGAPPTVAVLSPPDNTHLSLSQPLRLAAHQSLLATRNFWLPPWF